MDRQKGTMTERRQRAFRLIFMRSREPQIKLLLFFFLFLRPRYFEGATNKQEKRRKKKEGKPAKGAPWKNIKINLSEATQSKATFFLKK
jgi:hypothetical protein